MNKYIKISEYISIYSEFIVEYFTQHGRVAKVSIHTDDKFVVFYIIDHLGTILEIDTYDLNSFKDGKIFYKDHRVTDMFLLYNKEMRNSKINLILE